MKPRSEFAVSSAFICGGESRKQGGPVLVMLGWFHYQNFTAKLQLPYNSATPGPYFLRVISGWQHQRTFVEEVQTGIA
jgi:hypothetical protein